MAKKIQIDNGALNGLGAPKDTSNYVNTTPPPAKPTPIVTKPAVSTNTVMGAPKDTSNYVNTPPPTTSTGATAPVGAVVGSVTPSPAVAPTVINPIGGTPADTTNGIYATNNTYVGVNGDQYVVMSDGSVKDLGQSATGAATSTTRQNAFDLLTQQFTNYGVLKKDSSGNYDTASQGLLNTVKSLIMGGAGSDTASLALQASDAYKARFSGNTARAAAGLSVLSPADYIATENSYDAVLKQAGFPAGYANQAKFAQFIGNDMSATELTDRVNVAAKSIANTDPFYTQTLQNYYGLDAGHMISYTVDPTATLPLLQRMQGSANFGAAAAREGINVNAQDAQNYQALGVTQAQAEQGFQNIGTQMPVDQKLAQIYGGQFGTPANQQGLLESATFGGTNAAQAQIQLQKLQKQEENAFSGSAGVAKGSLQGDQGSTF
jgi:hypothetical protein